MWGPWSGAMFGGVFVALLLIAIAFGTSALLFPVLIAAAILGAVGVLFVLSRLRGQGTTQPDPVNDAAPASGEGSGSPTGPPHRA